MALTLLSAQASAEALRLDRTAIMDAQGFGRPVVAGTLFIPYGWQTKGGIEWGNQHACVNGYAINWAAEAPDGTAGMAALPQQRWEWNAQQRPSKPGCGIARIDSAESYLRAVFAQLNSGQTGGRVESFEPRRDLEREMAGAVGVQGNDFQRIETTVSAGQLNVTLRAEDGTPMVGALVAALQLTHIRTGGPGYGYGPAIDSWSAFAVPTFASWGKPGHYDLAAFDALRKSYLENPAWQQQIARHNQRMGQINREGIMQRAQIQQQLNRDLNQIITESWQNQQRSADTRAREFLEAINETETYADAQAAGGTISLSSNYRQAWKLADGSYVLTDDASFDPEAVFSIGGERLAPAQ